MQQPLLLHPVVLLLLAPLLMLWSEEKPLTGLVTRWGVFLRLWPSVGCGARAHSGPCPYWFIWLAVLCQGPLQAAPQGLGLGIRSPARYPAAAGVSLRPSRPQSGQRPRLRGPSGRRSDCGPPQGQGLHSSPQPGPRLGWGAAPPARGPGPLRPPEGRGRRGGRPHSPHRVGAGPPRSTCAATGTGEEQCKAGPLARPAGAWPCIAEGCPRATAGGQLDRAGARRGPALAATLPRPAPAGGWTGRAAARRPGWAGVRPAGRWGRVGRPRGPDGSPHHRPQAVAPLPVARSSCQRWGPGVGSDAAADSGPAAECSSTGASMVAPALWSGY